MADNQRNGIELPNLEGVAAFVEEYAKPPLPALPAPAEDQETDWESRHKEREAEREAIRARVRHSTGSNQYFHKGMPLPTISDDEDKMVAVYARVSTKSTEQTSSIENQQLFYTKKIAENEHWEMQEIYSDEGKSGMEAKHRTEFQRMIADAAKGKMDMIICASVSRFARDISDCLKYITKLRTMNPRHPVGVFFETENIYTLDPNSEQVLHFHALLAHWESANKSRRMILSYDQRICTGQYPVADLLGYRHTKDGNLIIQEDEAKTVRFAVLAMIAGKTCEEIAVILTQKKRKTLKGNTEWDARMVRELPMNERRWGDLEARKTIVLDPREKIIVKNNGIRDWAYVPNHHEGIITHEEARAARFMTSGHGVFQNGVPGLKVIDTGALKGFVSISPRWNGIDRDTLVKACYSVHTEEELVELEQSIRLWTGIEQSKVSSFQLTGYEVPRGIMFLTNSMPALTISRRSIRFNRACHTKLDNCEVVELLYHPLTQTVLIRKGEADDPNCFRWVTDREKPVASVETLSFSKAVYESLRWIEKYQFRFRGVTKQRGGTKIIIFSLDEPQILVGGHWKDDIQNQERVRYIPYTTEDKAVETEKGFRAYPQEWQYHYGLNCLMRKRRDDAISAITENDMLNPGIVTENPLIGELPSRQAILNELDDLLMSM